MPAQPSPEIQRALVKLDAVYRFTGTGGNHTKDPATKEIVVSEQGGVYCEIKDNTTGEYYAKEFGTDEADALEKAVAKALVSEKPLTKAQKAHRAMIGASMASAEELNQAKAALEAANARIAELEAGGTKKTDGDKKAAADTKK